MDGELQFPLVRLLHASDSSSELVNGHEDVRTAGERG